MPWNAGGSRHNWILCSAMLFKNTHEWEEDEELLQAQQSACVLIRHWEESKGQGDTVLDSLQSALLSTPAPVNVSIELMEGRGAEQRGLMEMLLSADICYENGHLIAPGPDPDLTFRLSYDWTMEIMQRMRTEHAITLIRFAYSKRYDQLVGRIAQKKDVHGNAGLLFDRINALERRCMAQIRKLQRNGKSDSTTENHPWPEE